MINNLSFYLYLIVKWFVMLIYIFHKNVCNVSSRFTANLQELPYTLQDIVPVLNEKTIGEAVEQEENLCI